MVTAKQELSMHLRIDLSHTRELSLIVHRHGGANPGPDRQCDVALQRQHVAHVTIECLRPDDVTRGSPNQLRTDADSIVRLNNGARNNGIDVQLARDSWYLIFRP